jgi:phospholipase/carboxylesterase
VSTRFSRREFCTSLGAAFAGTACFSTGTEPFVSTDPRLTARPAAPTGTIAPGWHQLWTGTPTAHLLVPEGYDPAVAWPLVVGFHGAGGTADGHRAFIGPYAESDDFLVLIPDSWAHTWDAVLGPYGNDITTLDRALKATFERARVDPARIIAEGFSDGASYVLGVGIINPEIFTRIVAFSPGFVTQTLVQTVKPEIFVSHGTRDPILPIDVTSRQIVPALENAGFEVEYHEFDGVHEVPSAVARLAVNFLKA